MKQRYLKCEFPFCKESGIDRNNFDIHHIIPKSNNGSDDKKNLICLCPNHHRNIFIEESKRGLHSIKTDSSIIILNRLLSTNGNVLRYKKSDGEIYLYFYSTNTEFKEDHFT